MTLYIFKSIIVQYNRINKNNLLIFWGILHKIITCNISYPQRSFEKLTFGAASCGLLELIQVVEILYYNILFSPQS